MILTVLSAVLQLAEVHYPRIVSPAIDRMKVVAEETLRFHWLAAGADLQAAAKLAGQRSLVTTARYGTCLRAQAARPWRC